MGSPLFAHIPLRLVYDNRYLAKNYPNTGEVIKKQNELEILQGLGVTPKQLAEKLHEIISHKDPLFQVTARNKVEYGHCMLCDHEIHAPAIYTIKNASTGETMRIEEMALHLLSHNYYVKSAPSRIEHPVKLVRVLGF